MTALSVWRFGCVAVLLRRRAFQWTVVLLVQLLSTLPLFAATQDVAATKDIPCFHRGVAIHNMMNWAAVEPSDPNRYVFPAFVGPNYETSDALLRNVAAAGFDFVRLTIDPGPFLQFTGSKREALDQHLKGAVERLLRTGFSVLVDFHPVNQVPKYAPEKLVQAEDDPLFIAYAGVIRRTAHLLATLHTNRVALELMNEPQYGWDPATTARWQRLLEHLHREARAEAPDLLLVLSGARGGDIKGLLALNPEPFAEPVVEREKLQDDPEFGAAPPGLLSLLFGSSGQEDRVLKATRILQTRTGTRRPDKSFVIDISVSSKDPAKAARLANAIATVYLEREFEAKTEASKRTSGSLQSRLAELRSAQRAARAASRISKSRIKSSAQAASW